MALRTDDQTKRIRGIKVLQHVDDNPDLSWIGEYSSQSGDNAIDRQERGDMGRGEFRYCNITLSGEQTGNPDSVEQDYQRLEAYNRGDWWMVGIQAEAEIVINGIIQKVTSGGLYGIESDSDASYFAEVGKEQLDELADVLKDLGFTAKQIKAAMPKDSVPV